MFPGRVHGVVVHMIRKVLGSLSRGNFTKTDVSSCFEYSISLKATAVSHRGQTWTGYFPRYSNFFWSAILKVSHIFSMYSGLRVR